MTIYDRAVKYAVRATMKVTDCGMAMRLVAAVTLGYLAGWRAAKREARQR